MQPTSHNDLFLSVFRDLRAYEGASPTLLRDDLRDAWLAAGHSADTFDNAARQLVDGGYATWGRACGEVVCTLTPAGVDRTLWLLDPSRRLRSMMQSALDSWNRWAQPGMDRVAA